ncbi:MAG: M28 family peptidase, partial [Clostridia bacterium]|nr:M28 family peptidase [Clostridia bacterium]
MSIYQRLENLSFTRPSGTEEERAAAAFLKGELVQAGFQVEEESFTYQRQVPRLARLSALTDEGETVFPVTGIIDSAGTAEGGVQAPLLYLKSLDDVTLSQARGKIVLFHDRLGPEEYRRVLKAGAVATIATSGTIRDTLENSDLETGRFRDSLKPLGPIPGFTIRMTDAVKLLRLHPSSIHFELQLQEETVSSQNLVVTIPGTDLQDEIIVAGAHYDSVPFSKGSWDNGAGAVEIISLVEHLREAQPRRTVKCVLFGSEETGLQGSKAYTLRHQDEVPKTKVMINVDVGGSILGKE